MIFYELFFGSLSSYEKNVFAYSIVLPCVCFQWLPCEVISLLVAGLTGPTYFINLGESHFRHFLDHRFFTCYCSSSTETLEGFGIHTSVLLRCLEAQMLDLVYVAFIDWDNGHRDKVASVLSFSDQKGQETWVIT